MAYLARQSGHPSRNAMFCTQRRASLRQRLVHYSQLEDTKTLKLHKAVIFSDFLSVIRALVFLRKHRNPVVNDLYSSLCAMYASNQHVLLCCVPGHRGISGNMLAEKLATSLPTGVYNSTIAIPPTDLKPFLCKMLRNFWQSILGAETSNKLN